MQISNLIGLLTLGTSLKETPMFRQFLSGMAAVVTLTIVIGMMVGALLLGGLYGFYLTLIQHGLETGPAILTVIGTTIMVIVIMTMSTIAYLKRMFDIPRMLSDTGSPMLARFNSLIDSFADGLLTRPPERKPDSFKPVVVKTAREMD